MARRRNPFPGLVVAALLPAVLLGGCWRIAEGRVPPALQLDPPAGDSASVQPLTTPMLSVRRTPGVLARELSATAFAAEVARFASSLDETSCVAVSVDGLPVGSVRADTPLRPASNVKLITAAVALDTLGPDYTFTTELRGKVSGGVVAGDLYVVGGGDPLLTSSWWNGPSPKYPPFNVTPVEQLVSGLQAAGISAVQGAVIGDASRYDDEWYAPSWTNDVRFSEGGPVSALLMNDSRYGVIKNIQDDIYGSRHAYVELHTPKFADFCASLGAPHFKLADPSQSAEVLAKAFATRGPVIVEVDMDAWGPFAVKFAGPPLKKD